MQKAFGVCMCVITEKILNLVMSSELDIDHPVRRMAGCAKMISLKTKKGNILYVRVNHTSSKRSNSIFF